VASNDAEQEVIARIVELRLALWAVPGRWGRTDVGA
jgi:hypothetical protein